MHAHAQLLPYKPTTADTRLAIQAYNTHMAYSSLTTLASLQMHTYTHAQLSQYKPMNAHTHTHSLSSRNTSLWMHTHTLIHSLSSRNISPHNISKSTNAGTRSALAILASQPFQAHSQLSRYMPTNAHTHAQLSSCDTSLRMHTHTHRHRHTHSALSNISKPINAHTHTLSSRDTSLRMHTHTLSSRNTSLQMHTHSLTQLSWYKPTKAHTRDTSQRAQKHVLAALAIHAYECTHTHARALSSRDTSQ